MSKRAAVVHQLVTTLTAAIATYACAKNGPSPSAGEPEGQRASDASASSTADTNATCSNGPPERHCLPPRIAPPHPGTAPAPPPPFNHDGCAAGYYVADACAGIGQVVAGPTLQRGECCYQVCKTPVAPCGRPLALANEATPRMAPLVPARRGWRADDNMHLALIPDQAARDAWLQDARAEHASVASFGRFALELLAVGAPAELVEDAHRAALDEVAHTRAALAIAQALAPEPRHPTRNPEPGPLPLSGFTVRTSLADVASAAVREGCCGETWAAMALATAASTSHNTQLAGMLHGLAEDETRHAALAYRFVAWALAQGDPAVRAAVDAAFDAELRGWDAAPLPVEGCVDAARAGRLTHATAREVRADAKQVIASLRAELKRG